MKSAFVGLMVVGILSLAQSQSYEKSEQDQKAEYHLQLADSLETAGVYQGAALVYKMIAELYPNTMYYADAVRNLGHLYVNPFNSARDDSMALTWLTKHLEISWLPRGERTRSVIMSSMIRDRMQVTTVRNRHQGTIDSLSTIVRLQSSELDAKVKKVADLQSELEQTDNDLRILLEFQKNPNLARRDSLNQSGNTGRFAEAADAQQSKERNRQSTEQMQKLREIDMRALQRRTKR